MFCSPLLYLICFIAASRHRKLSKGHVSRGSSSSRESTSGDSSAASSSTPSGEDNTSKGDTSREDLTDFDDEATLSAVQAEGKKGKRKRNCKLTTSVFKQYPFVQLFATGPRNPETHPHSFYCRLCKKNYSLRTKGIGELKKHFRSRKHFRADQLYRASNFLPVYNKRCEEVTGDALEAERVEFSKVLVIPTLDSKRLLVGQEAIPAAEYPPDSDEISKCQIALYSDFLSNGCPLETIPSLWGRFSTIARYPAGCSNFDWSASRIFVCFFLLPFLF